MPSVPQARGREISSVLQPALRRRRSQPLAPRSLCGSGHRGGRRGRDGAAQHAWRAGDGAGAVAARRIRVNTEGCVPGAAQREQRYTIRSIRAQLGCAAHDALQTRTAQSCGRALLGPTSLVFRYPSQKDECSSNAPTRACPRRPRLDREKATLYKRRQLAQVAQLVEHCTENAGVGGSIPPLGTTPIRWPGGLLQFSAAEP
jgi:hypothetical protein